MCRQLTIACALVLALAGCRQDRAAPDATAPASATRHEVVAGESNPFFTARSHKSMVVAPGVRAIAIRDEAGNERGVRLIARDNHQVTVHCECPEKGCANPDGSGPITVGCIMARPARPSTDEATCVGECTASDQSCMSCGLVYDPAGNGGWASAETEPPVVEAGTQPPPTGPNDAGR